MMNYFDKKEFVDEEYVYPLVFWGTSFFFITNKISEIKDPIKPKQPMPPGCLSSIFGSNRSYKIEYENYLKELREFESKKKDNVDLKSLLYDKYKFPRKYINEYDKTINTILEGAKTELWDQPNNKIGLIEDTFKLTLTKYFPGEIIQNKTIDDPKRGYRTYTPDFIFEYKKSGLRIDIEIDEPYSLETREPLHYWSMKRIGYRDEIYHIDRERNDHFRFRGWFVLRFSEQQVLQQPNECCHVISDLIEIVTKDKTYSKKLSNFAYPNPMSTWAINHCLEFEKMNLREIYLDIPFLKSKNTKSKTIIEEVELINEFLNEFDPNEHKSPQRLLKYKIFK